MNYPSIQKKVVCKLKENNQISSVLENYYAINTNFDIIAISNILIGFKIIDDSNSFLNISQLVNTYSNIFDKNYLIINDTNIENIKETIPSCWGIIKVSDTSITKVKDATANVLNNFANQLKLLSYDEEKNIAKKLDLHILDSTYEYEVFYKISSLDKNLVKPLIINTLKNKKSSLVINDNANENILSQNQKDKILESLSNINFDNITIEKWIDLFYKNKPTIKKQNKQQKVDTVKHKIKINDIHFSLGVPWISENIINNFDYFLRFGENPEKESSYVHYEPITGCWTVSGKNIGYRYRINDMYGLQTYSALSILEATLNLREIKLFKEYNKCDEERTLLAIEKQETIQELFRNWVLKDEDICWQIEESYNKIFSKYNYSSLNHSKTILPAINCAVKLYDYQIEAVKRLFHQKNSLLAFDVGLGKTYIMIQNAMLKRQLGISLKNMFVVPNNIVGQWENMFKTMFPNSNLLVVSPNNFKPKMRNNVLKKMLHGDYDGIIIAYSCFSMIPLSNSSLKSYYNATLNSLKKIQWNYSNSIRNKIEKLKKQLEDLDKNIQNENDAICFDNLGINGLYVDEAHNFKNISISTNHSSIRGINVIGSAKCNDMLLKVRAIQNAAPNNNVVFATGTPICNSMSDIFTLQTYLQYDDLVKLNLDKFDNWIKTFAKIDKVFELDANGHDFTMVDRLCKFFNLPELSQMFSDVAIFYSNNNSKNLPSMNGYSDTIIPVYDELQMYMNELRLRSFNIRSLLVPRTVDNMLKVTIDGRKSSLDLRLVNHGQPYNKNSKIFRCVENVISIYNKYEGSAQIVFCDISTPKNTFNVYEELKTNLIIKGVPANEIAFIHDYEKEIDKKYLFKKVNAGEIRVLIGSTFKLGLGSNVQTKLKAIHHLDVPWRPSDMVQREGRIIREGNTYNDIEIFRYICIGSFDAYLWQILETKQRFISQFLSGTTYQRSTDELDNCVLTYAEVKAITINNPKYITLFKMEYELRKLQLLSSAFIKQNNANMTKIKNLKDDVNYYKEMIATTEKNYAYMQGISKDDIKNEFIKLGLNIDKEFLFSNSKDVLKFLQFNISLPYIQNTRNPYIILERLNAKYFINLVDLPKNNQTKITNFITHFDKLLSNYKQSLTDTTTELLTYENTVSFENIYEKQIADLSTKIAMLKKNLAYLE